MQTTLNQLAGTHNELYERAKKGVDSERSTRSKWAHRLVVLPAAAGGLLTAWSTLVRSPCCLEWSLRRVAAREKAP